MGMYTEIVAGFQLRRDTPLAVIDVLKAMIDGVTQIQERLPEHSLFELPRWRSIGQGSSFDFGFHESLSQIIYDENEGKYAVAIRASLKNTSGEVEAFFDWVRPYVSAGSGTRDLIGYSIYEEAGEPTLYYANVIDDE